MRRLLFSLCLASAVIIPGQTLAHTQGAAPHDIWSAWTLDPFVLVPLALFVALYGRGVLRVLRRKSGSRPALLRQTVLFAIGCAFLLTALVWPLDAMGESLFTAHMAQHMVLMVAAAPLLVVAEPLPFLLLGLPHRARRALVAGWAGTPVLPGIWRVLSSPVAATLIQLTVLFLWHAPGMFRAALANDVVHWAMHASFLLSALLFWWSVLAATRAGGTNSALAVGGILVTFKLSGLLGYLFAVTSRPIYEGVYTETAAWGLRESEDQQLAGVVMMLLGMPVYFGTALAIVAFWLTRMEAASDRQRSWSDQARK